jgi:group I intron endonuclease
MTTNLINGKKYIGKDTKNNPKYLGSGLLLKKSIKKHGNHKFEKKIIEVCSSQEELIEREEYWLNYYNAANNPMFYNLKNQSIGFGAGKEHPLYGKGKYGKEHPFYGRKHSLESKKKMSEKQCGENNPMFGKTHLDSTKKKMSEYKIGKKNPMFGKTGEHSTMFGRTGEKCQNFKGYVLCISGDYEGQRNTSKEWAIILNTTSGDFSSHLSGKKYKNGIKGNFFKWEHEIK